jgi:hypothetical protein
MENSPSVQRAILEISTPRRLLLPKAPATNQELCVFSLFAGLSEARSAGLEPAAF